MHADAPTKKWAVLVVLSLALAIIIIDTTLLNVSLSSIIHDLHTDIQSIQWVITSYSLTLAALTITGGRLGDLYGRKRMFVLGAILFAIGSFIASISQNVPTMIIGESIIEGIGAALMMPATSSLLLTTFQGRERAIAFGVWGGIAAGASAIGPILGGYLATNYSWRWGFRINVLVVVLLCLGSILIKESRDTKEKPSLDWVGVFLSAIGLLSFIFGVIESSRYGWWIGKEAFSAFGRVLIPAGQVTVVPFAIAMGLLLIALFVVWEMYVEARKQTPLVSMKLFANEQFRSGTLTTAVLSLSMSGLIFSLPVFLQSVRHLDAFHTGLTLLPLSATLLIVAPVSASLTGKVRPKTLIQIGLVLNLLSSFVLYNSISVNATAWSIAPGLALFGAGMGLVMSQINNLTLSAVPVYQAGEASGVNNTLRQAGSSLGSAIIGAVLLGALATNLSTGILNSPGIPDTLKSQLAEAVAKQTSNVEFGGGAQLASSKLPPYVLSEIKSIGEEATVKANRTALLYGALFALLGVIVSFQLPNKTNIDSHETGASAKH